MLTNFRKSFTNKSRGIKIAYRSMNSSADILFLEDWTAWIRNSECLNGKKQHTNIKSSVEGLQTFINPSWFLKCYIYRTLKCDKYSSSGFEAAEVVAPLKRLDGTILSIYIQSTSTAIIFMDSIIRCFSIALYSRSKFISDCYLAFTNPYGEWHFYRPSFRIKYSMNCWTEWISHKNHNNSNYTATIPNTCYWLATNAS